MKNKDLNKGIMWEILNKTMQDIFFIWYPNLTQKSIEQVLEETGIITIVTIPYNNYIISSLDGNPV